MVHSSVLPPQGFAGAFSPLNIARIRLPKMTINPAARNQEPDRRNDMAHVVLGRIIEVPPRHSLEAEDEHAEVQHVEADEEKQPADLACRSLYILPVILGNQ